MDYCVQALKKILEVTEEQGLPSSQQVISALKQDDGLTLLQRNLLIHCAEFDLLPKKRFEKQPEVNRYVFATVKKLETELGLEKKQALDVTSWMALAYATFDAVIQLTTENRVQGIKLPTGTVTSAGVGKPAPALKLDNIPQPDSAGTKKEKKSLFSFGKKKK